MTKLDPAVSKPHFDLVGAAAGAELQGAHYDDFLRLVKSIRYGSRTQLLLAEFDDFAYRTNVIGQIDAVARGVGQRPGQYTVNAGVGDVRALEDDLAALASECGLIHVVGDQTWFDDLKDPRWEDLNLRREAFFKRVPVKLLFWLTPARVAQLARAAPDLWAWRGGVYDFTRGPTMQPQKSRSWDGYERADPESVLAIGRRIAELRGALETDLPDELRLSMLDETAALMQRLGRLDEALRIRREETLPVFERLGDVRSAAVTRGQIADVLQARGELDEALRIRREEELPVYERLGDVRSAANVKAYIAMNLDALGDREGAITLLREAHAAASAIGVSEALAIGQALERLAGDDVKGVLPLPPVEPE